MPGGLLPWIELRFFDADGAVLSAGTLETYIAGTSTPAVTYTESDLNPLTANPTTITLDADGRPPDPIYLGQHGYKFIVKDALGATVYTFDEVQDVGAVWSATYGEQLTVGAKDEASGYTVVETDRLVTMDSTGGANPCVVTLPAAADFSASVTIKNMGTIALAVTPNGSDTIDGLAAAYTVAASASPLFRSITLISDGVDAWWIVASVGV